MSIAIGAVLAERFQVVSIIGEGCFGRVYTGLDLNTDATIVIKQLKPGLMTSLAEEYGIMRKLADSTYVPTPIFISTDGSWFVTSYEGKDLFCTLADNFAKSRGPRTPAQVLLHSLLALKDTHDRGYVHGDISARNLAVSENQEKGKIVLIDFGAAGKYSPKLAREDITTLLSLSLFGSNDCKLLREKFSTNEIATIDGLISQIQDLHGFSMEEPFEWQ